MTLKEIENTLETLTLRHESLSESTLVILLRAGGWDEKIVRDAVAIFRRKKNRTGHEKDDEVFLPALHVDPVLPPEVDSNHLLPGHVGGVSGLVADEISLVSASGEVPVIKRSLSDNELPHNLPVKPFESTPHTWTFSKYKSIFYGDDSSSEKKVPHKDVVHTDVGTSQHAHITLEVTPLSRDEHRLVVIAVCTFLAIVLFLGYMYSNGRL
jgi:hypothetical protein